MASKHLRPETVTVHEGRPVTTPDAALNEPVAFTSTYVGGGELGYGRYANPNW